MNQQVLEPTTNPCNSLLEIQTKKYWIFIFKKLVSKALFFSNTPAEEEKSKYAASQVIQISPEMKHKDSLVMS